MTIILTAAVIFIFGLFLAGRGAWLMTLGGNWYYLIAGLGLLLTAILLFRRKSTALSLYALVLVGTLAWAISEVGFDWWQLGSRGGVPVLLALWLLTPWVRGKLEGSVQSAQGSAIM